MDEALDSLKLEMFAPLVGRAFDCAADGETLQLKLGEAKALGAGLREGGAFSLVFEGPTEWTLEQGAFELRHGDLATVLFLVPIGPFGEGLGYEAVFT